MAEAHSRGNGAALRYSVFDVAMDDPIFWIFLWIAVGGVVGAVIGSAKGNGGIGFACGALLGPIGWIIAVLLDYPRKCPACQCGVPEGATVCKSCGHELPRQSKQELSVAGASSDSERKKCPLKATSTTSL